MFKRIMAWTLVFFLLLCGCNGCKEERVGLVEGIDNSDSFKDRLSNVTDWEDHLLHILPPSSSCKMFTLSSTNKLIFEQNTIPTSDDFGPGGLLGLIKGDPTPRTRPLNMLLLSIEYCQKHPDLPVVVVIFTDGDNDFFADKEDIKSACAELLAQNNLRAIGLFGLTNNNRLDWSNWLGNQSDRRVVIKGVVDADSGIEQIGDLAEGK
ncbi:MAG: hypothetical protein NTW50_03985 [Candidatus Berkelbacteria bacterium]|nr:hypothetical protein [Candidatus Berkelbacteria bacterium]